MIEKRHKLTVGTGGPHRLAGSGPGPAAYTHSGTAAAGRVVVSVQSVPQVSPARVQGSNPSDLSSKINKIMSAIILSKLNRKIKLEFSMTTLKSLYQKNYHLLIYRCS